MTEMFSQLKDRTRVAHHTLEKTFLLRLRALNSPNDYGMFLAELYQFHLPLEAAIAHHINIELLPDFHERRKSALLMQDLTNLGFSYSAAEDPQIPQITSVSRAVGSLYVIEGSTHGGPIIAGMLRKQLNLSETSLGYFLAYGDQTRHKWEKFKNYIMAKADNLESDEVLDAANSTFTDLNRWLLGRQN